MTDTTYAVLEALACGRPGCACARAVRRGHGLTHCPVHDDRTPSLSVDLKGGRLLWNCRAGCAQAAVLAELQRRGLLHEVRDHVGQLLARHERKGRWLQPDGRIGLNGTSSKDMLYGLERVAAADAGRAVVVVEGEKAAAALHRLDILAVGTTCGAGATPSPEVLRHLRGRPVVLWPDADEPGLRHMALVADELRRLGAQVLTIEWPQAPEHGDAADFVEQLADQVDDDARRRAVLDFLRSARPSPGAEAAPYAVTLADFIANKLDSLPPLIGTEEDNLLPAGGLLLLVGKGGKGKTTLTIDAVLHAAAGAAWLDFPIARGLRILLIENEGPREPFRRKLERKRKSWVAPFTGEVFVKTMNWGAFTVAEETERRLLRTFIVDNRIDLVVGDPLDSMGIEGVGSPADTRKFMGQLVDIGLTRDVAFWLLHHPIKGETEDELDQASGAWGGRPDTMLVLGQLPGNRARLSFPKVRWGNVSNRPAAILAYDPDTEDFSVVDHEGPKERDLFVEIRTLLADGKFRTDREICATKTPKDGGLPGIGANRDAVKATLEANPDTFTSFSGSQVGRRPMATLWRLAGTSETGSDSLSHMSQMVAPRANGSDLAHVAQAYIEARATEPDQSAPATWLGATEPEPVPDHVPRVVECDHATTSTVNGVTQCLSCPASWPRPVLMTTEVDG